LNLIVAFLENKKGKRSVSEKVRNDSHDNKLLYFYRQQSVFENIGVNGCNTKFGSDL